MGHHYEESHLPDLCRLVALDTRSAYSNRKAVSERSDVSGTAMGVVSINCRWFGVAGA